MTDVTAAQLAAALPAPSLDYQIIPTTDAPYQAITITLNGQPCLINVYTKSINVPIQPPGSTPSDPNPTYENINPVFVDLYVNGVLVIGGVIAYSGNKIVRDAYLGFVGDIAIMDTQAMPGTYGSDPYGVPARLPPPDLRNFWQRHLPVFMGGQFAPKGISATIPGLGSRYLLTYWPKLT